MIPFSSDIAFTSTVKNIQAEKGSRASYSKVEQGRGWQTAVTSELTAFLAGLDMFYLGTANAKGQPYIQYRGGAPGVLKVIDEKTLGFADFGGNRQYITLGNLSDNPQAFIFLMDYVNSRRIKIWGTAKVVEDDPVLLKQLEDPEYSGRVERAILFSIEAWDINCPQHIHKRFLQSTVAPIIEKQQAEIQELQSKISEYEQRETVRNKP
ncbi:MAG: pyridoxamine 5'-phosphate oxidase family protein [Planctomycetaceae bacterium]|nr:pyridoxamine 5'-phosphate oxidase family protein [Planctomycetaceae bacterium]